MSSWAERAEVTALSLPYAYVAAVVGGEVCPTCMLTSDCKLDNLLLSRDEPIRLLG